MKGAQNHSGSESRREELVKQYEDLSKQYEEALREREEILRHQKISKIDIVSMEKERKRLEELVRE